MRVRRNCILCEKLYWAKTANSKYCSEKCQKEMHSKIKKIWFKKQKDLVKERVVNGV